MPIIAFIVCGFLVLDTFCLLVLTKIEQDESVSVIFKARRIVKLIILVEVNALNFSFVFIPVKYAGELFLVVVVNASALLYFLFDLLYLSEKKREYLLWLQQIVFSSNLFDVFDLVKDDGSKYEEIKTFKKQMCSIIKKENKLCIQVGNDNNKCFLVPKTQLSKETLALYCQKLELDIEREKDLKVYSSDVDPIALEEYDNLPLPKHYLFIKRTKPKIPLILTIVLMVLLLMIAVNILVCIEVLHIDPFGWMEIVL